MWCKVSARLPWTAARVFDKFRSYEPAMVVLWHVRLAPPLEAGRTASVRAGRSLGHGSVRDVGASLPVLD
ncbi:hypothetical protein NicSoilC5_03570 [Arthrobacter sp. NicSoilC5]|nr:hypothetical protein NicSoilC5_03570 [Arthrobacter sp. NicSoilC5]